MFVFDSQRQPVSIFFLLRKDKYQCLVLNGNLSTNTGIWYLQKQHQCLVLVKITYLQTWAFYPRKLHLYLQTSIFGLCKENLSTNTSCWSLLMKPISANISVWSLQRYILTTNTCVWSLQILPIFGLCKFAFYSGFMVSLIAIQQKKSVNLHNLIG
jgi:hypothetical protein